MKKLLLFILLSTIVFCSKAQNKLSVSHLKDYSIFYLLDSSGVKLDSLKLYKCTYTIKDSILITAFARNNWMFNYKNYSGVTIEYYFIKDQIKRLNSFSVILYHRFYEKECFNTIGINNIKFKRNTQQLKVICGNNKATKRFKINFDYKNTDKFKKDLCFNLTKFFKPELYCYACE